MQWSLECSTEIAAPPAAVREKFLNFSQIPTWSPNGFIQQVSPIPPSTELQLISNEAVDLKLAMGTFKATIVANTPEEFVWCAGIPYVLTGTHHFKFTPASTPGCTTFTQVEYFTGALAWMMGDTLPARLAGVRKSTGEKWDSFNQDLKAEMEKK